MAALLAMLLLPALAAPVSAADADKDGLWDGFERKYGLTDPNRRDSDGDGVVDSAEDHDGDGLGNLGEQRYRTHPGKRDTDGDGTSDANEDQDRDGRTNAREQDERRIPADLEPALGKAKYSVPPLRDDCLTPHLRADPVVCGFGPRGATKVAIIGDSHALMWSSPVKRIAAAKGWRLLTMVKSACPPLLGLYTKRQVELDRGATCQRWRKNVIGRLAAYPPDLIIITHSDRYTLSTRKGTIRPRGEWKQAWRQALERTLKALPRSSNVLVLGDVPHNQRNPQKCLTRNRGDMSRCVTKKPSAKQRQIEFGLRNTARAEGASYRTLFGKICSYDPCPVVQGDILMWRDRSHVTNRFAVQLRPSMRAIIEDALR